MRLVLYSLPADMRKANGFANIVGQNLGPFANHPNPPNLAIRMEFIRPDPQRPRYILDQGTRDLLMFEIGLLGTVEELVIIMHGAPGTLSVAGGVLVGAPQAIPNGSWSQDDCANLIAGLRPGRVFFVCCQFGRLRMNNLIPGYQSADGPLYIAQRTHVGTYLYSEVNNVLAVQGMPVLDPNYYARTTQGQQP